MGYSSAKPLAAEKMISERSKMNMINMGRLKTNVGRGFRESEKGVISLSEMIIRQSVIYRTPFPDPIYSI